MKTYIERGVHFGDTHSFRDLNLVLAPFDYTPAVPKTKFIEIPGGDGTIDATEADGTIHYYDREFEFIFSVMPGDKLTFEERQTVVARALNGKRFEIVLDKDPEYFWRGRVWIDEYASNKRLRQIVVVARVSPYKVRKQITTIELQDAKGTLVSIRNDGSKTILPKISGANAYLGILVYGENRGVQIDISETPIVCERMPLHPGDNLYSLTYTIKEPNDSKPLVISYQEEDL